MLNLCISIAYVYSAISETLFYLAYGFHPLIPDTSQFALSINITSAWEWVQELINSKLLLEQNWMELAQIQAKYYDQKHTAMSYKVGDQE